MNEEEAPRSLARFSYEDIHKAPNLDDRKTKIIASIGKQSQDSAILVKLIDAGMDMMRLGFDSQDMDFEAHNATLANLVKAQKVRMDKHIGVIVDLQGPVVKTGFLKEGKPVSIAVGQDLKIISDMTVEGDSLQIASSIPLSVRVTVG